VLARLLVDVYDVVLLHYCFCWVIFVLFSVFCFDFVFCFVCFVLAFGSMADVFLLTFGSSRVRSV
jgi:hypothetical protein